MSTFTRHVSLANQIVFIDGISGSGKSILGPILASFDRVEKYRLESIYEYISQLHKFKKIETDAAISLMRIYADEAIYKLSISREVNFRIKDNTGFLNTTRKWRYIKRLFQKDGAACLERIKKNNPILQTNSHQMFPAIDLAFKAYGSKLTEIEMVRHPLFLINHWINYVDFYGSHPRDLTLWVQDSNGNTAPWFAAGWESEYNSMSPMDKSIRSISNLFEENLKVYNQLTTEEQGQIIFIPFEKFVTSPWEYLATIENKLGTKRTALTKKELKRQKCPRNLLTDGRGHQNHGWRKPENNATNLSEYEKLLKKVENEASQKEKNMLCQLISNYESKFDVKFS